MTRWKYKVLYSQGLMYKIFFCELAAIGELDMRTALTLE